MSTVVGGRLDGYSPNFCPFVGELGDMVELKVVADVDGRRIGPALDVLGVAF